MTLDDDRFRLAQIAHDPVAVADYPQIRETAKFNKDSMRWIRQAALTVLIVATFLGCVNSSRTTDEDYEEPPLGSELYDSEYRRRDM